MGRGAENSCSNTWTWLLTNRSGSNPFYLCWNSLSAPPAPTPPPHLQQPCQTAGGLPNLKPPCLFCTQTSAIQRPNHLQAAPSHQQKGRQGTVCSVVSGVNSNPGSLLENLCSKPLRITMGTPKSLSITMGSQPAAAHLPPGQQRAQSLWGSRQEDSTPVSLLAFSLAGHQQCIYFIFMAFILLLCAAPEGTQDVIYLEEMHLKNNLMYIPWKNIST